MSSVAVVVLVLVVLVALLAAGGAVAQRRRLARNRPVFEAQLAQANADLAEARAHDRGWDPATMEAVARDALTRDRPAAPAAELTLVRVLDRPGTEEDKAVYRAGDATLTLARQDGAWVLEKID